ncbi:MAG: type II toxin-antitoxin system VapC family toxin [Candidatus Margulisbacteria bacterium]|jgi:predicted nucleic acid-binding protein|nr:type II toxin-antitoxin system VapC family toxin [Candidatus Margulisiibacteriota bacterium]
MSYLLDTNVISELYKKQCNPLVRRKIDTIPEEDLYISVISLGEMWRGIKMVKEKTRFVKLLQDFNAVTVWFAKRTLPVDYMIMLEWGEMCAKQKRTLSVLDSLLAATARAQRLILLTRNARDFQGLDVNVLDPWKD